MTDNASGSTPSVGAPGAGGPGLLEQLIDLGRHRRALAIWPLVGALVAAIVSLILPKWYTATTRILPPQQSQSTAASMLSQLGGGLGGLAGGALGIKNPTDLYVGMLRSDTVADAAIARFDLKKVYREDLLVDTRRELREHVRFAGDKAGIITIEVEDRDPVRSADLANGFVDELHKLTSTLAVTEAAQRRVFFERQLQLTKDKLADAEVKLRQAMQEGGLVSMGVQGRAAVETVARLHAQVSVKEVQIGAMRAYATPNNPEMLRAEQEVAALRRELARLESGAPGAEKAESPADAAAAASGVANVRLLRDVRYHEVMFELMAKQYEMARADESREAPLVQVLDRAAPPERHSRPKRLVIVLVAFAAALFGTIAALFIRAAAERPEQRQRLAELRSAWLGRRS